MSDKYILRSGAIDAIKRNSGTLYTREAEFLLQKVIFLLKTAPDADVVEVVHGQWVHSRYEECSERFELVKCSQCGHEAYAMAFYVRGGNYCPNCGVKMDGGENDVSG